MRTLDVIMTITPCILQIRAQRENSKYNTLQPIDQTKVENVSK